jgi:hypothetical protein
LIEEKRLSDLRDAGLVSNKSKIKTAVRQPSSSASQANESLFDNVEDSSTAHRTFAAAPSPSFEQHNNINSFIQAFDEDDGVLEDLQPLRRISRDYKSDNRSLPSLLSLYLLPSHTSPPSSRHSIIISGENMSGSEKVLASIRAPLLPPSTSAAPKGPQTKSASFS